ncbi:hypothetical protein ZOSMA_7G00260 [Zostera marina]|uniref:Pentatricopeptide repeat-containing protein n=1 Tax=Zostera marina TaxID=29655 RepID=A0A0K9NPI6_ZOSMR|nr:hypothetical protein ZOSMA_7G00260 [Zostera marina]
MNPNHIPQISACNCLLSSLVDGSGNFDKVIFVYKEMVKRDLIPNVETINCLIKCLHGKRRMCSKHSDIEGVVNRTFLLRRRQRVTQIEDSFFRISTLCGDEMFDEMSLSMDHRTPSCSLISLVDGLFLTEKLNQSGI